MAVRYRVKLAGRGNLLDYGIQKSLLSAQIEPSKLAVGVHLAEPVPLLVIKEEIESAVVQLQRFHVRNDCCAHARGKRVACPFLFWRNALPPINRILEKVS